MISTVLKLIRLIPAWLQFSDVYILGIVTLMIFTGLKKQIIVCWIRNFRTAQGENQQSTKRNNLSTTRYSFNHVSFYRKKSSKPKNSLLYNQHFQKEIAFLFLFPKIVQYLICKNILKHWLLFKDEILRVGYVGVAISDFRYWIENPYTYEWTMNSFSYI